MPRSEKKPRRLVADGHTYLWTVRHGHRVLEDGGCRKTLTLHTRPSGTDRLLRLVFDEGPGRYVAGFTTGSGEVGENGIGALNLHEPGTVRVLLDAALARGWRPAEQREERERRVDGWTFLEAAVAARARPATTAADRPSTPSTPSTPSPADPAPTRAPSGTADPGRPDRFRTGRPRLRP
ncbi:hypothetical protein ACWGAN_33355 [Streptomyces sp. NPDC054945]